MSDDRCQVQSLDGTEACPKDPYWTLSFPNTITRDMVTVTVCRDCGDTWIDKITTEGRAVTVNASLRRRLRHIKRDDAPCTRKGCDRPQSEHDFGIFCP